MSDILLTDTSLLYLRKVRLTIASLVGSPTLIEKLRINFDVTKTNESNPNRSKIEVYNLSEQTRSLFEDKKTRLVLEAGYVNTVATIFQGNITKAYHKRDGTDIITTAELGDGDNRYRNARMDKGFPPGISADQVIKDISDELGLPISSKKGVPNFKYANGLALSSVVRNHLDMLAAKFNFEWSIQDETLQIIPRGEGTDDGIILISSSSGLVGSPSKVDKGVEFETLLMPTLRPGRRVQLESKFVNGIFKLRTVAHVGDSHTGTFRSKNEATI